MPRVFALLALLLAIPCAVAGSGGVDARAFVEAHNGVRARHCAAPLRWSPRLESSAKAWAATLRGKGCALQHSGGKHGENLAGGTAGTLDAAKVVSMWYAEGAHFNHRRGGFSMKTGHFTQVVWKSTTELGCAKASCDGIDVVVCQYDPPGNFEGEYRTNVAPTSCR